MPAAQLQEAQEDFALFASTRPQLQQHSVTSPFAGMGAPAGLAVAAGKANTTATAAAGASGSTSTGEAASAPSEGSVQSPPPARVRSISYTSPSRVSSNRSVVGSAPSAAAGSSWSSYRGSGSPPLDRTPSPSPLPPIAGGQRRSSSPGGLRHDGRSSSSFSFTAGAAGASTADGTARAALRSAGSAGPSGGSCPGVAGLGGGFGFYGGGSSRRLSASMRGVSPGNWQCDQQQAETNSQPSLPTPQQQQRGSKGSKGAMPRGGSSGVPGPPQLLPLQPPVELPCPAAVPEGLPAFQMAVETHRLGRYGLSWGVQ